MSMVAAGAVGHGPQAGGKISGNSVTLDGNGFVSLETSARELPKLDIAEVKDKVSA
jgi:hypothetical protein